MAVAISAVFVLEDGVGAEDVTAAGEDEAVAAAFIFLSHECLPGEAEAATPGEEAAPGEAAVVAVTAVFFKCLCLCGLADAPGVGLEAAVWANAADTEKANNAIRGMILFIIGRL